MKQTPEQTKILDALIEYVKNNKTTFANIAKQLGVTQNTISNWKKGASISFRNQQKIMTLIGLEAVFENCSTGACACRNTDKPVLCSLLGILGELPERDIAKIYAYALELRDVPIQFRYPAMQAQPVRVAAEEQAPFN